MPPRIFLNSLRIGLGSSMVLLVTLPHLCWAGASFRSSVGGVTIDSQGVLRQTGPKAIAVFRQVMEQRVAKAEDDMNRTVPLRKISLSALQHELRAAGHENTAEIPEEHRFLGGLQRICVGLPGQARYCPGWSRRGLDGRRDGNRSWGHNGSTGPATGRSIGSFANGSK